VTVAHPSTDVERRPAATCAMAVPGDAASKESDEYVVVNCSGN